MEKIVSLAKRRGFIYPGSEIYGGVANTYDYGPMGVELLRNIRNVWWEYFVHQRSDMVGLEASIISHRKVWEASGHVTGFADAMIDCKNCQHRMRADHLIEEFLDRHSGEQSNSRIDPGQSQDDELTDAAEEYDQVLRTLHAQYPRNVGLLGMGADGHIAGLVPQSSEFRIKNSELFNSQDLVIGYTDEKMGERITQTFHALSLMDEIFVLVLGEEKKHALQWMQEEGTEDEVPARFFVRPEISPKVTIITDQKI